MKDFFKYLIGALAGFAIAVLLQLSGCGKHDAPISTAPVIISPTTIKLHADTLQNIYANRVAGIMKMDSIILSVNISSQKQVLKDRINEAALSARLKTDTGITRTNVNAYVANAENSDTTCATMLQNLTDQNILKDSIIDLQDHLADSLHQSINVLATQSDALLNYTKTQNNDIADLNKQIKNKNNLTGLIKWAIPAAFILGLIIKK